MRLLVSFTPLLVLGLSAASASGDEPDVKAIIARANEVTKSIKMISYKAEAWGEEAFKDRLPRVRATVKAKQSAEGRAPLLRLEGVAKAPGSGETYPFHLLLDGKRVLSLNQKEKIGTVGTLPEALGLILEQMQAVVMHEFLHPEPFGDELGADSLKYEGEKTIAGTNCHVIYVVYAREGGEAHWYFGIDDNLPRRVDRVFKGDSGTGVRVLELSELNTAPKFDQSTFVTDVPEGYERRSYVPPLRSDPRLLPVGSQAPDWTLKTPKGEAVSLAKLRGKVVVLDFWATWCAPCIKAMPGVQKLHERFKDKPVVVFGVNAGEVSRNADPAAFMKKHGFTYGLLLDGEKVSRAYRVVGIPTFYVIGPGGKILYAVSGYSLTVEEGLARLIESVLEENK